MLDWFDVQKNKNYVIHGIDHHIARVENCSSGIQNIHLLSKNKKFSIKKLQKVDVKFSLHDFKNMYWKHTGFRFHEMVPDEKTFDFYFVYYWPVADFKLGCWLEVSFWEPLNDKGYRFWKLLRTD